MKCWGSGQTGYTGQGNTSDVLAPNDVSPIAFNFSGKNIHLCDGSFSTSSCAVGDDGQVRFWGLNDGGQLGIVSINNIGDNETLENAVRTKLSAIGRPLMARIDVLDKTYLENEVIRFDGSKSFFTENLITYHWAFGDGNESNSIKPTHTYTAEGVYSVVLTVTDRLNRTSAITKTVNVFTESAPPLMGAAQD